MDPQEFPPNSDASKKPPRSTDKKIESVVSGGAQKRKRSLRKQFTETFVAGDAKSAGGWVIFEVVLPGLRDLVVEAGQQGIEKLVYGLMGRRRGGQMYSPPSGPTGVVNYRDISKQMGSRFMPPPGPERVLSRQARAAHNFDEIVLELRSEAEDVIDRLIDLVDHYGQVSVADLYELVGLGSAHTDHNWGWTDLSNAGVSRVHGGYLLDLPAPHPLAK